MISEKVGLIGRNGRGKSTLLRLISGHEQIDERMLTIVFNPMCFPNRIFFGKMEPEWEAHCLIIGGEEVGGILLETLDGHGCWSAARAHDQVRAGSLELSLYPDEAE
ncbi:ATP-binding cassette domain-containing protein [Paenibacillus sp. Soil522]|uniref:ATP-binding cassette domain-containing protein n=1 Tax=Paenibacillus sp. Soil522 TaxID=1736388 RepID=UPI0012DFE696|nr:ATP-binding cassette domain-containing protein [Paenibacillus sp. Soil522]